MYKKIVLIILCLLVAISCSSPSSPTNENNGDIVNGGGSGSDGGNSGSGGDSGNTGDGGDIPWTEIAPPLPVLDEEAKTYGIDISQDDSKIKQEIETKLKEYYKAKSQYKVIFTGTPKAQYSQQSSLAKLVLDAAFNLEIYSKNVEIDISKIYFNERKVKSSMFKGFPSYADCTITFTFPENTIRVIEGNAFSLFGKHFKEITIPDSVIGIKAYAFQVDNNLSKVTFGADSKLEYVEDLAFSYCPIKEIVIPASVTSLGRKPFGDSLTTVTYLGTKPNAIQHSEDVFDGCTALKTLILPNVENPKLEEWQNFFGGNFTTVKQK